MTIGELTYEFDETPRAYICVNHHCQPPVESADHLADYWERTAPIKAAGI